MLRTRRPLLALLLLGVLLAAGYLLSAVRADPGSRGDRSPGSVATTASQSAAAAPGADGGAAALATVPASALPVEAQHTLQLIERGGPFPYEQDGRVFGNVERLLPPQPRGWYREYTVPTPAERDRGARRIVSGRDGTRYYTADHYGSFTVVERDR